jgi:hypothetical protein
MQAQGKAEKRINRQGRDRFGERGYRLKFIRSMACSRKFKDPSRGFPEKTTPSCSGVALDLNPYRGIFKVWPTRMTEPEIPFAL